jgi:hypothetical protein
MLPLLREEGLGISNLKWIIFFACISQHISQVYCCVFALLIGQQVVFSMIPDTGKKKSLFFS